MSIVTFQSVDGEVQAAEATGFVGLLDAVDAHGELMIQAARPEIRRLIPQTSL